MQLTLDARDAALLIAGLEMIRDDYDERTHDELDDHAHEDLDRCNRMLEELQ